MMTLMERELEVERIKNLVSGFGWNVSNVETGETKVIITLEKQIEAIEVEIDKGAS